MGSLLTSVSTGLILAIIVVMVLSKVGIDVAPILASAGIIGVALGFGAQNLVKDFLSGIFMILEDQYGVGDVIDARRGHRHGRGGRPAGHATARRQRHRLVRAQRRDRPGRQPEPELGAGGARRHGQLRRRTWPRCRPCWSTRRTSCSTPRVRWRDLGGARGLGRRKFDKDGAVVRLVLKTAPLQQWFVARAMRQRIKARFDAEGIAIPRTFVTPWGLSE